VKNIQRTAENRFSPHRASKPGFARRSPGKRPVVMAAGQKCVPPRAKTYPAARQAQPMGDAERRENYLRQGGRYAVGLTPAQDRRARKKRNHARAAGTTPRTPAQAAGNLLPPPGQVPAIGPVVWQRKAAGALGASARNVTVKRRPAIIGKVRDMPRPVITGSLRRRAGKGTDQ
jgi:hypothetical protein